MFMFYDRRTDGPPNDAVTSVDVTELWQIKHKLAEP